MSEPADSAAVDPLETLSDLVGKSFDPLYGEAWTPGQLAGVLLQPTTRTLFIGSGGACAADPQADAIGFALSRRVLDEEELLLFAILPEWRGRGHGRTLLASFLSIARDAGVARAFLEMRSNNSARSLYEQSGFRPCGLRKAYYRCGDGSKLDAITFEHVM